METRQTSFPTASIAPACSAYASGSAQGIVVTTDGKAPFNAIAQNAMRPNPRHAELDKIFNAATTGDIFKGVMMDHALLGFIERVIEALTRHRVE